LNFSDLLRALEAFQQGQQVQHLPASLGNLALDSRFSMPPLQAVPQTARAAEAAPQLAGADKVAQYLQQLPTDVANGLRDDPRALERGQQAVQFWQQALENPTPLQANTRGQLEQLPGNYMLKLYDELHPQRFPESYAGQDSAPVSAASTSGVPGSAAAEAGPDVGGLRSQLDDLWSKLSPEQQQIAEPIGLTNPNELQGGIQRIQQLLSQAQAPVEQGAAPNDAAAIQQWVARAKQAEIQPADFHSGDDLRALAREQGPMYRVPPEIEASPEFQQMQADWREEYSRWDQTNNDLNALRAGHTPNDVVFGLRPPPGADQLVSDQLLNWADKAKKYELGPSGRTGVQNPTVLPRPSGSIGDMPPQIQTLSQPLPPAPPAADAGVGHAFVPTPAERILLESGAYDERALMELRTWGSEARIAPTSGTPVTDASGAGRYATPADVIQQGRAIDNPLAGRGEGTKADWENIATQRNSAIQLARSSRWASQDPEQQAALMRLGEQLSGAKPAEVAALAKLVTENAPTQVRYHPGLGKNILEYPPTGEPPAFQNVAPGLTAGEYAANRGAEELPNAARNEIDQASRSPGLTFSNIKQDPRARSQIAQTLLDAWTNHEYAGATRGQQEFQQYHHAMTSQGKAPQRSLTDYTDGWNRMVLQMPGSDTYILELANANDHGTPLNKFEQQLLQMYDKAAGD
jgi:hypothetical protein